MLRVDSEVGGRQPHQVAYITGLPKLRLWTAIPFAPNVVVTSHNMNTGEESINFRNTAIHPEYVKSHDCVARSVQRSSDRPHGVEGGRLRWLAHACGSGVGGRDAVPPCLA